MSTVGMTPGKELAGKVALVTGGASGIGRATVAMLLDRGARVGSFDLDAAGSPEGALRIDGDARAARAEPFHRRRADAARAAGDERDAALEVVPVHGGVLITAIATRVTGSWPFRPRPVTSSRDGSGSATSRDLVAGQVRFGQVVEPGRGSVMLA